MTKTQNKSFSAAQGVAPAEWAWGTEARRSQYQAAPNDLQPRQGIHPGFERGEPPVLVPQLLGLAPQRLHPLLDAGIPSPVEQLLLFEKASPTMNQTPHC